MKLADAKIRARDICGVLEPFCSKVVVAGSIRRGKAEVGDLDLVAIPKACFHSCGLGFDVEFTADKVWSYLIPLALRQKGLRKEAAGSELIRFLFPDGFQVDLYRARPETWGVILLVKTGSKEHNVKLCMRALSRGLKLSASQGVLDGYGEVMASCTEEKIFAALGLSYVEPEDREVF